MIFDTRQLYEDHPYPVPSAASGLIHDLANMVGILFPEADLAGWRILDAGCGTGHRLVSLAQRYPEARFLGVDRSANALSIAGELVAQTRLANVELRQADLFSLTPDERFDLVASTGVVHHLDDPRAGLVQLSSLLAESGLLLVWLYHALGEFERLLDRELARTMAAACDLGPAELLRELGLSLSLTRYGTPTSAAGPGVLQTSLDVDAFLNPTVHAFRFEEILAMLGGAPVTWAALNGINSEGGSKLVDLGRRGPDPYFCLTAEEVFTSPRMQQVFDGLPVIERVRVIELVKKPTGFTVLAGRGTSYLRCEPRVHANVIELPAPSPVSAEGQK